MTQEQKELDLDSAEHSHHNQNTFILALSALGVVYGDIGTSPLYAIKECFNGHHALLLNQLNVFGILSLAFCSLTIVVTFKYLTFIMRADNHGEGGIFALLALIPESAKEISPKTRKFVILAGLLGASLLYGDGVITPTISVLSAVEGLEVATEAAKPITVPLTCVILFGLFYFQKFGTEKIGKIFGPIMIFWFTSLAVLGLIQIIKYPTVLHSINPIYAYEFFVENQFHAFLVLGSVVLCITGGEALYADMGHFGRRPIQISWFGFVFPALLLNYFGQGALLLSNPKAVTNPFYSLVPSYLIIPMVVLSTMATVIASQALISGVFSLTKQAVQLGYLPRLNIIHTSEDSEGQIYIPFINKLMMIACLLIVIYFRESSKLASAYGLAVTADMVITSTVFFFVLIKTWNWPVYKALPLVCSFLVFDLMYFSSNLLKFFDGGWFPFTIAMILLNIILIWKDGRDLLGKQIKVYRTKQMATSNLSYMNQEKLKGTTQLLESFSQGQDVGVPIDVILREYIVSNIERVKNSAVFMTVSLKGIPPVLFHHLTHNQVLHEQVVLLSIKSLHMPYSKKKRIEINEVGYGFYQIIAFYGFMEIPNVPEILKKANEQGFNIDLEKTTYYLGRESLLITNNTKMMKWRKSIFAFISKNALPATAYFSIPPNRVVELGMQIEI